MPTQSPAQSHAERYRQEADGAKRPQQHHTGEPADDATDQRENEPISDASLEAHACSQTAVRRPCRRAPLIEKGSDV